MKRKLFICPLILVICYLFSACLSPYSGPEEGGRITVNFGGGAARWAGSPNPGNIPDLSALVYELTLRAMPSGNPISTHTIPLGQVTHNFTNIAPGDYVVTVIATYHGYNFAYGESEEVTVTGTGSTPAPIQLQRLPFGGSDIPGVGLINGGIVLNIPNITTSHTFPGILDGDNPDHFVIEIGNFSNESSATITANVTGGFIFSSLTDSITISIAQDNYGELRIVPPNTSGTHTGTLNINSTTGGFNKSVALSIAVDSSIIPITTEVELAAIGTDVATLAGSYILMSDLSLSSWEPINGTFTGIFDGNGHTITINNFTSTIPGNMYIGLFSQTGGAEIFDLKINLNIDQIINTTLSRIWIGGLSGFNSQGGSVFSRIAVTGEMRFTINNNSGIYIGGIMSAVNLPAGTTVTLTDCYSNVDIILTSDSRVRGVGGITNFNEMCNAGTLNIVNNLYAGSISVTTTNTGAFYVGGIFGMNHTIPAINISNSAVVSTSLSISGSATSGIQRIIGETSVNATMSGNIARGDMSVIRNSTPISVINDPGGVDGEDKTAAELFLPASYPGWDFVNVWQMGAGWPILR